MDSSPPSPSSAAASGPQSSKTTTTAGAAAKAKTGSPVIKNLRDRPKREVAREIQNECNEHGYSKTLNQLLEDLLSPDKSLNDPETIEWCKWLIAGGRSLSDFSAIVRGYDNHAKCGLVWIPHVVAYRCRTCGISPCMSICRDCFKRGNHKNHDFNMFLSQAGGACDCGDTSVMKADGFCSDHGINNCANKSPVPLDLMTIAELMMPTLILRLLLHFRGYHTRISDSYKYTRAAKDYDEYCSMLMEFNNMGELMRRVMTKALINPQLYKSLVEPPFSDTEFGKYIATSKKNYEAAVHLFPSPEPPEEYKDLPALGRTIVHKTLLEEFIFWTFKYEFPQNVVCFLLNMLPDQDYKEHLTRTFVMHYSRIPSVLEESNDPDTMSNRVVHMSVQLFSNESLALKMVEELSLLHVMIISLRLMMTKILIQNTLHDPEKNFHFVIDCAKRVMKEHCYWPLVSDFNNVLSHESVALVFLRDDNLIDMWFQFLSMLQGMNVNTRETGSHVEFEPSSYYAAFSCELEASAYPMWSIISHLKDSTHAPLAKKIIYFCINYLQDWLEAVNFYQPKIEKSDLMHASFHFPLHRYLAAFTCQAVKTMGMSLNNILPSPELLTLLMMHPLRVQSLFYEILSGVWVRNGLQIKGQAMTYIQANFCNSMVDMDLFFLQICATQLPANLFLTTAIDIFGVSEWLGMGPLTSPQEMEQDSMLEGLLTFLATLVTSRTNLGNDEPTQCIIEISALLSTGDKTHSQLLELMPERSGNAHTRNFEKFLKELSIYRPPPVGSENLEQGLFMPVANVWEQYYDPLHVLLRAVHRRDFQNSMDRFSNYVKQEKKMPKSGNLWPPFRLPKSMVKSYSDPACILSSKVLHSTILGIFYRAVHSHSVSEQLLALAVFLLEMAVCNEGNSMNGDKSLECSNTSKDRLSSSNAASGSSSTTTTTAASTSGSFNKSERQNSAPELLNCFPSNCLWDNLRLKVSRVSLNPQGPQVSPANYNNTTFDSDVEWELSESDTLPMLVGSVDGDYSNSSALMVPQPMDVAVPQDLSIVRENSLVVHSNEIEQMDEDDDDDDLSSILPSLPVPESMQALSLPEYVRPRISNNISDLQIVGTHLALPPPPLAASSVSASSTVTSQTVGESTNIISESGLEIAIRRDFITTGETSRTTPEMFSSSSSNSSSMILPFNRVQPVAIPSRNLDVVPTNLTSSRRIHSNPSKRRNIDGLGGSSGGGVSSSTGGPSHNHSNSDIVVIEESVLSLLLKLHSQLSGTLDSFSLEEVNENKSDDEEDEEEDVEEDDDDKMDEDNEEEDGGAGPSTRRSSQTIKKSESRIGDGPYFIGNLLRKIAKFDDKCAKNINEIRQKLWPNQRERQAEQRAKEIKEKEERSKKAKERQQKLMQEFANKQKQFMAQAMSSEANMDCLDEEEEEIEQPREKEYDCIICNTTGASTESNPIGLVVLVESSSIVGHRRLTDERFPLPICDEDKQRAELNVRLSSEFNKRVDILTWKFGATSWFLSHNIGWEGGVHVQSCGHHVHLTCQDAYLKSLYTSNRPQNLNVERGEFFCPVCRQLANSVLPLTPQLDRPTPIIRVPPPQFEVLVNELLSLIQENKRPGTSKFHEAMGRAMESMTNSTQRNIKKHPPTVQSLFSFVVSIARTNLESEIIQRGGSLCSQNDVRYKPKRDCIVPLLHVLSLHVRLMISDDWPIWKSWSSLCGIPVINDNNTPVPSYSNDLIPNLLSDPCALLLKFILLAPLHLDQVYFTCIVKVMYNLLYYQIILQLCTTLSDAECTEIMENYVIKTSATTTASSASTSTTSPEKTPKHTSPVVTNIGFAISLVLNKLDRCDGLRKPDDIIISNSDEPQEATTAKEIIDLKKYEDELQRLCLPFLRVAALLRHHIYHHELPDVGAPHLEFARLVYYLELVTTSMDWDRFNATKALCFIKDTAVTLPQLWCDQLRNNTASYYNSTRELVLNQHVKWQQPKLLGLPREYERLFTYYHEQPCLKCLAVPKESSICLLCGTLVCLKQTCCKEMDCCEAVRHSISCGGGTGIFLVVTSTYIIIIRGRRACLWGSLYLDDYDEEDRDLKRGKPLYLSEDRFNLLESQWLSHRFAHTKHAWVWHRDSL